MSQIFDDCCKDILKQNLKYVIVSLQKFIDFMCDVPCNNVRADSRYTGIFASANFYLRDQSLN